MSQNFHQALSKEFESFEKHFRSLIESDFALIEPVSRQVFAAKGKQLRPLSVFLIHKLFQEEVNEQAYLAASLIEILHAASLVHDDVVDMADLRRGKATVRSLFGNKTAVLAGDYLISNAFIKAYGHSSDPILLSLVNVVKKMSEGEILQLQYVLNPDANEDIYFQIIERKTAELFACCCACGALTAGASAHQVELCREIGRNLGIAFQIQDDLLDLDALRDSGKSYGNDLKEGKLTLPVLAMLALSSDEEKDAFMNDLRTLSEAEEKGQSTDTSLLDRLVEQIRCSDGIDYVRAKAQEYYQKAFLLYRQLGKDSPLLEELMLQICGV